MPFYSEKIYIAQFINIYIKTNEIPYYQKSRLFGGGAIKKETTPYNYCRPNIKK